MSEVSDTLKNITTQSTPDSTKSNQQRREEIIRSFIKEREKQFNLPGSEWDQKNTPNDWIAIISHYLSADARRNADTPDREKFEESLIKAGAVLLAALEHCDAMEVNKTLTHKDKK